MNECGPVLFGPNDLLPMKENGYHLLENKYLVLVAVVLCVELV